MAKIAATLEMTLRQGIRAKSASIRGATRKRSGPMPIASIASTSSETCIVPSSAVKDGADARREHDPGEERPELAGEGDRNQAGHESLGPESFQLITGQERHR